MKKKILVPIVLSSIGLLIGGLIYLGISSFPELLESEKAVKPVNNNVVPFVDDTIVVEGDKLFQEEPTIVSDAGIGGYITDYIPSSFNSADVQYIDAPINLKVAISTDKFSNEIKHSEFSFVVEEPIVSGDSRYEFIIDCAENSEHPEITGEHLRSYEEAREEIISHKTTVKKARVNKNQAVRSNEALVETSLLVIGAVDIFSMILIHRRKHLFR